MAEDTIDDLGGLLQSPVAGIAAQTERSTAARF